MKMRVEVKVIPNARRDKVTKEGGKLKVYVRAPVVEGKANRALIKLLAEFFGVRRRDVRIIRGERSRVKLIEISEEGTG